MEDRALFTLPEACGPDDLASAARLGDAEAFGRLVRGCERTLYRVARTVLRNDQDCADAVQEALSKAWLNMPKLREPRYFRTWLTRILLNECYRQARRGRRARSLAGIEPRGAEEADGWQAAAVAGGTTWYYNAKTHALARADEYRSYLEIYGSGGTPEPGATPAALYVSPGAGEPPTPVEIALDPAGRQEIDADTFLAGQDGRWLAFTVHESGGDRIWVVTSDGRKMAVPDDVRWVNGNENPVGIDFTGASLLAMGESLTYRTQADGSANGVRIRAEFPEGGVYLLEVSFSTDGGKAGMLLDDRKGVFSYVATKTEGQAFVSSRSFICAVADGGGKYTLTIGGRRIPAALQSNRFTFFKCPDDTQSYYPLYALFAYRDDPDRALWELDTGTGKLTKVATGCAAAGWIDGKTYWYAASADSAAVLKREAPGADAVHCQVQLCLGAAHAASADASETNVTAFLMAFIRNDTAADVTIPEGIPCSLRIGSGGGTVWSKEGAYHLSDSQYAYVYAPGSDNSTDVPKGPVTLRPGEALNIMMPEFGFAMSGAVTMEGGFYNAEPVSVEWTYAFGIPKAPSVGIRGEISRGGRLKLTVDNRSRAAFSLPQPGYAQSFYPPGVRYRLLSGGRAVGGGTLRMETGSSDVSQADIPPGGALTLTESGDMPEFAGLAPGSYTLQCCLEYEPADGSESDSSSWGAVLGYYFDVPFTVP